MTSTIKLSKQELFEICETDHEIDRCNRIICNPESTKEDVTIAVQRILFFREMLEQKLDKEKLA